MSNMLLSQQSQEKTEESRGRVQGAQEHAFPLGVSLTHRQRELGLHSSSQALTTAISMRTYISGLSMLRPMQLQ